jgi:hypothetical protein
MVSSVDAILAVRDGLRKPLQITTWPSRTLSVEAASAESEVNDSKVSSSVGRGTVWKWSNSQIDSKPSRSARRATSSVRAHARSGSQPSYSPVHPCGTIRPSFMVCTLLGTSSDDHLVALRADRDVRDRHARE